MAQGSLAEKLRVLRARKGLTLAEAAGRARITPDTLSELERGKRHAYTPTLHKIAEGYGVPVEELLEKPVPLGETPVEQRVNQADLGELLDIKDDNPGEIKRLLKEIPLPPQIQKRVYGVQDPEPYTPEEKRLMKRVIEAAEEYRMAIERLEAELGRERQE
jgi:transcriptional regulator with XRE-family HTH domain